MKKLSAQYLCIALCLIGAAPYAAEAQNKTEYATLTDALFAGQQLNGKQGPESVNWINDGQKYSYIAGEEIRSMEPATLKDELIFSKQGLTFPGTAKP
ncbi:MAG: ptpA 5, partial [Mucilaginibacter sp.]|nr:ptpA 5 [Mucilaginibacter sp.]